jgi:hypothetical protein
MAVRSFTRQFSGSAFKPTGGIAFGTLRGRQASTSELGILEDFEYRNDSLVKSPFSKSQTVRRVSQKDYENLLGLDLFRGGDLSDVTNTKISSAKFKQDKQSGNILRTSGSELSLLDEAGLEDLARTVSARQGQIQGAALAPGLERQSFSLLSGNFG